MNMVPTTLPIGAYMSRWTHVLSLCFIAVLLLSPRIYLLTTLLGIHQPAVSYLVLSDLPSHPAIVLLSRPVDKNAYGEMGALWMG